MQNANVLLQTTPSFLITVVQKLVWGQKSGQDFKLHDILDVCHKNTNICVLVANHTFNFV